MAQILGPMVLRHFLKVLALARILGPTVLRHFLNIFFRASGEANSATQRYCSKHVLRDGFRYTTILVKALSYEFG